jgi:uncharacterized protein (DUF433 family)
MIQAPRPARSTFVLLLALWHSCRAVRLRFSLNTCFRAPARALPCWARYNLDMDPNLLSRITIEPGKCGGKPCIRGQRLRVTDVIELVAAGASFEEILRDYPFLERDDIVAALTYAARQTDHVVLATTP